MSNRQFQSDQSSPDVRRDGVAVSVNGDAWATVKDYLENVSLEIVCVQEHNILPDGVAEICGVRVEDGVAIGHVQRQTVQAEWQFWFANILE